MEQNVEIIKAKNSLSDRTRGKVIDRQRVAAYCRVSTLLDACERAGVTNQISIISFDGLYPGLIASMRQDFEQIGRTATELLLQWLLLRQRPEKDALLEAEYVDGTSLKQR